MLGINAVMVVTLAAFLVWDYVTERRTHLSQQRIALGDEAQALLPFVIAQRDEPQAVQGYLDDVCGRMRDASSPGHHIAAVVGERTYQAHAHQRASPQMLQAMQQAVLRPNGIARAGREHLVVGSAESDDVTIFVSEYLSNVERILRRQVARRALSVVALGAVLVLVVNLLLNRLAAHPLAQVVEGVRRVRSGDLGTQVPTPRTAELRYLADEFNAMSAALQEADRHRRAQMAKARTIQENLLPSLYLARGPKVAYLYRPAAEVGGDFFDLARREEGPLFLCIADVAGHGVPAAMGAAMLKTLFTAAIRTTDDPALVLTHVHEGFSAVTIEEDFATMFVAAWGGSDVLRYASAGHEAGYLLPRSGETRLLGPTGALLGSSLAGGWQTVEVPARSGDRLVVVTDGLADLTSSAEEPFGRKRLASWLATCKDQPLEHMMRALEGILEAHRDGNAQRDDITVLAVDL